MVKPSGCTLHSLQICFLSLIPIYWPIRIPPKITKPIYMRKPSRGQKAKSSLWCHTTILLPVAENFPIPSGIVLSCIFQTPLPTNPTTPLLNLRMFRCTIVANKMFQTDIKRSDKLLPSVRTLRPCYSTPTIDRSGVSNFLSLCKTLQNNAQHKKQKSTYLHRCSSQERGSPCANLTNFNKFFAVQVLFCALC